MCTCCNIQEYIRSLIFTRVLRIREALNEVGGKFVPEMLRSPLSKLAQSFDDRLPVLLDPELANIKAVPVYRTCLCSFVLALRMSRRHVYILRI